MKVALITLSREGARICERLTTRIPQAAVFVHESVGQVSGAKAFSSIMDLTAEVFSGRYDGLVYVAPCGAVVRAIAPNIQHKTTDPAVVVVDTGGRYAVSLLSGHEGGANDLAVTVSNILGAEPVISTTTEALKTIIVGVGCRRGTKADVIVEAVKSGLDRAGVTLDDVRLIASADIKSDEAGLLQAARELGVPLRFVASEEIRSSAKAFGRSDFVKEKVNLPAVAEPAALLAGRRTSLLLPKTVINGVTVAVARESCLWSE
ncbi:MAG: cobalamin biosynthesis protein [Planctomycetota bacterium]